jgi:hypothetical protein
MLIFIVTTYSLSADGEDNHGIHMVSEFCVRREQSCLLGLATNTEGYKINPGALI